MYYIKKEKNLIFISDSVGINKLFIIWREREKAEVF